MQRRSKPLSWRGKGLSDTLDASNTFTGAMASLQNLIPDPTTSMLWQPRPAAQQLINFNTQGGPFSSEFSSEFQTGSFPGGAGAISVYLIVGNFVYGMIGDPAIPGHDVPFCYNLATNQPVAVSGTINATTTPASQPTTGAWTPPQMDVISTKAMVCHPGFTGAGGGSGNFLGWFDISTPGSPAWNAGNLSGAGDITFTVAPTGVAQFNGRAYYIYNLSTQPSVIYSDALSPTTCTNSNQILTFGDITTLTQIGKLPLNNQLGGIIQALMVFKDDNNIYQITGDAATSNLSVNSLNVAIGTEAPNTVVSTPKGLAFMATDGLRVIDYNGNVSDPVGIDGRGVNVPFVYSFVPSRMCAACNGNILRISTQNGNAAGSPNQEYWYDFSRQIWTGPHTFPAALIAPFGSTFIMVPTASTSALFQSDVVESTTSTYIENGTQMTWNWLTALLPDIDQITNNAMTESTLDLALPSSIGTVTIGAQDQNASLINSVQLSASENPTIWGQFTWGSAPWGGSSVNLQPYQLPWSEPIVFARMSLFATGNCGAGLKIGALHMRYQMLKTFTSTAAAA